MEKKKRNKKFKEKGVREVTRQGIASEEDGEQKHVQKLREDWSTL